MAITAYSIREKLQLTEGRKLRLGRRSAGYFFVAYLVLVGITMVVRSQAKQNGGIGQAVQKANTQSLQEQSKLHLQDFSRVQMKDGRESYEIKAKDAKYFAEEGVTYVVDAELTLPRRNGGEMKVFSDSARLFLDGEALERAELEGNVIVQTKDPMTMQTDAATYNATDRIIIAPGAVDIRGPGYSIEGVGLEMGLDTELSTIQQDVRSRFEKGTQVPPLFQATATRKTPAKN